MNECGSKLIRLFIGYSRCNVVRSTLGCSSIKNFMPPNISKANGHSMMQFSKKTDPLPPVVEYEDVKNHLKNGTALVVDVRNPKELEVDGILQGSVLIPLNEIKTAFDLSPVVFMNRYKVKMPGIHDPIIFSCLIGKRSARAQEIVQFLGFKNTANYLGSFADWKKRNEQ